MRRLNQDPRPLDLIGTAQMTADYAENQPLFRNATKIFAPPHYSTAKDQ